MSQKKRSILFSIVRLFVILMIYGCTSPTTHYPSNKATITFFNTPTISSTLVTELATHTSTPLFTLSPTNSSVTPIQPTLDPIDTPTPQTINDFNGQSMRICAMPPKEINILDSLKIRPIAHMGFLGESVLEFDGWGPIDFPEISPAGTPHLTPFAGIPSSRLLLNSGSYNVTTGEVLSRTLNFRPLLQNPCYGECPLTTVSQSPDEQWQLIHIYDWQNDLNGVWLVSNNQKVRLVNYVPYSATWEWSADNTLLWYVYSVYDFGQEAIVTQLDESPIVMVSKEQEPNNPLFDATYYSMAFAPQEKTVLITPFDETFLDNDELITFDLAQDSFQPIESKVVSNIKTVFWNQATNSYLLVVIQEDGVEIWDRNETPLVQIPRTILEVIYPTIKTYNLGLGDLFPNQDYALSFSGHYLAIGYGNNGIILLFECG